MDSDRILHSLGVANKMVEIGTKKGLSPKDLEDLFTLGINHDIGYKFGEGSNHQIKGGLILKRNGYIYIIKIIRWKLKYQNWRTRN